MMVEINTKVKLGLDTIKVDNKKYISVNQEMCGSCAVGVFASTGVVMMSR